MPSMSPIRFAILALVSVALGLFPLAGKASAGFFAPHLPSVHAGDNQSPAQGHFHEKTKKAAPQKHAHHTPDHTHQALAPIAASMLTLRRCGADRSPAGTVSFRSLPPGGPDHPPKYGCPLA